MLLCLCQLADPVTQTIPLRLIKAGTQSGIAVFLAGLEAPFTSVIDTGNARHTECHGINQRQMILVVQNTCHTGHIVVVHKGQQMLALIQGPVLRSELT